jgi:hypothetical protein
VIGSSQALDDRHVGLPSAFAHRLQPVAATGALQFVEQRSQQLGARGAQGVAQRDRAPIDVHPLGVGPDFGYPGQYYRCERLVDLH